MSSRASTTSASSTKGAPKSARSALTNFGSIMILGISLGLIIQAAISLVEESRLATPRFQTSLSFIILLSAIMFISTIMVLLRERMTFSLSEAWYSIICTISLIIILIIVPIELNEYNILNSLAEVGLAGDALVIYSIRPNYGPEANKRIYQAYASIIAFIVAFIILFEGLFIKFWFEIDDYAGAGTYPDNEQYIEYYIRTLASGTGALEAYNSMINAGVIIIVAAVIIMFFSVIRKIIGPLICSIIIFGATIMVFIGLILFDQNFNTLSQIFATEFRSNNPLLIIGGASNPAPPVYRIGIYLVIVEGLTAALMLYASFAAKPIDKWRRKRDQLIAAAEVSTREQRLPQAVKYLEAAAEYSSKINEEDKAIELLTRIKQIQDKAIKMRKSQAAQKAKREYKRQQRAKSRKKKSKKKRSKKKKSKKKKSKKKKK